MDISNIPKNILYFVSYSCAGSLVLFTITLSLTMWNAKSFKLKSDYLSIEVMNHELYDTNKQLQQTAEKLKNVFEIITQSESLLEYDASYLQAQSNPIKQEGNINQGSIEEFKEIQKILGRTQDQLNLIEVKQENMLKSLPKY